MFTRLRNTIKTNPHTRFIYGHWKEKQRRKSFDSAARFENRQKHTEHCVLILAGYKEFTWDIVFSRIRDFVPNDIDVCIVSSGLYSERLSQVCQVNNWSYLATSINCVTLALNSAIESFPSARYVYKIDEDIFVTKNFFSALKRCYAQCMSDGAYRPGFVAPLIPVNGYGHMRLLQKLNLVETYASLFERPMFAAGADRMIESSPEVAKFFWGKGSLFPDIDSLDARCAQEPASYAACPIRFSIGAIFFARELWEKMGYFKIEAGPCMGLDEAQICSLAMSTSDAVIVSENTVVGHLSFGKQNDEMRNYFLQNPQAFALRNET